jgi:hypothetical protein
MNDADKSQITDVEFIDSDARARARRERSRALDRILDSAFTDDTDKPVPAEALPDLVPESTLPAPKTISPAKTTAVAPTESGISYAIASQPERLAEARRRAGLTPEPTKSTLTDLRQRRLLNHKNAGRTDEIDRMMAEYPDGEYNQAFNDVMAGESVENKPAPKGKGAAPKVEHVPLPVPAEFAKPMALRETTAFRNEVKTEVARENERPVLVVEGRSDAIFIEGLWRNATNASPPFRILTAKGRRALRYLLEDDEFISEVGDNQRVLGLFDFDEAFDDWSGCHKSYPNREGDEATGLLRRHVSKQIYVGLLPVPQARAKQAGERFGANSTFTIELYLPDNQLSDGQNLETVTFPGDVQIVRFRGDKVAFAERVSAQTALLLHFDALLALIQRVLQV